MIFFNILNCPSFPIEDRIHSLQMTGIRDDAHSDRMVVFREIFVMSCAEMVLDIPRKSGYHTLVFSLNLLVVELTENFLVGFWEGLCKDVQTAKKWDMIRLEGSFGA